MSFFFILVLGVSAVASKCTPPREGIWIIDNYETPIDFTFPVNGHLTLTRNPNLPNVYGGHPSLLHATLLLTLRGMAVGNSMFFTLRLGPVVRLYFYLHAVFDEVSCRLHGTTVIPYLQARNEVNWAVEEEGTLLRGPFNIKIGNAFLFPISSMQIGTYNRKPLEDSFLPVPDKAGYLYANTTFSPSL